uniref:Uncharacterized protein n=1 Tax=Heterorhabditis bacteriophora TaxID=37862 RepID=A0A1I7W818_HETBA
MTHIVILEETANLENELSGLLNFLYFFILLQL